MLQYEGSIWRPLSEARSPILQATLGCSHNAVLFFGGNFAMDLGIQYTSCSDGKKPVCFKLERLEETVTSGY